MIINLDSIEKGLFRLPVTDALLDNYTTSVILESEPDGRIFFTWIQFSILNYISGCSAVEIRSSAIGARDVKANRIDFYAIRLTRIEIRDFPDIIPLFYHWAGTILPNRQGGRNCKSCGEEECSSYSSVMHFDGVGGIDSA